MFISNESLLFGETGMEVLGTRNQANLLLPSTFPDSSGFHLQISSWSVKHLVFVILFIRPLCSSLHFPYSTYFHASKLVPTGSLSITFLENKFDLKSPRH